MYMYMYMYMGCIPYTYMGYRYNVYMYPIYIYGVRVCINIRVDVCQMRGLDPHVTSAGVCSNAEGKVCNDDCSVLYTHVVMMPVVCYIHT